MPKTTLAVRADEKPWTAAEAKAVRTELESDLTRLRGELDQSARELQDLLRDVLAVHHPEVERRQIQLTVDLPDEPLVGAAAVHGVLCGWRRELNGA